MYASVRRYEIDPASLGELKDRFEEVDMFTTAVIGNSTTYVAGNRMITPRGYRDSNLA